MTPVPHLVVVPQPPPDFRRVGLDYEYTPDGSGLTFKATFIKRSSDFEVAARVEVTSTRDDTRTYLLGARFNLSSDTQRRNLAKSLSERAENAAVDWRQVIEAFCVKVERAEARGGQFKRIGCQERAERRADLIERLLPAGKMALFYGPPGVGKGLLYVGMAVAMKVGLPSFCGLAVRRGEPLVIDYEDDDETFLERVQAVSAGLGVDPPDIAWFKPRGLLKHNVHELAEIVTRERIDCVFLDSVGHAGGAGGEHSNYETVALDVSEACRAIGQGAEAGSLTWAWIDHVSAAGAAEKLAGKAIGAYRKIMDARVAWELRKQQESEADDYTVALYHEKHNHTRKFAPVAIRLEFANDPAGRPLAVRLLRTEIDEYPELASRDGQGLKARLHRLMLVGPHAKPAEGWAEDLDADVETVKARLRDLKREGKARNFENPTGGRQKKGLWGAVHGAVRTLHTNPTTPKGNTRLSGNGDEDVGASSPLFPTGSVGIKGDRLSGIGPPAPPPGTGRLPYAADDEDDLDDSPF